MFVIKKKYDYRRRHTKIKNHALTILTIDNYRIANRKPVASILHAGSILPQATRCIIL
jgi:hypothetical protein